MIKDYVIGSARWAVGTRVEVTRWDTSLNVLANYDGGGTLGTQPNGATGTIIDGPEYGASFIRYKVDFDTGADGWVGEYQSICPPGDANAGTAIEWLSTATPGQASNPDPANTSSPISSLPTDFTWTAASDATSYRVYLDGIFKSTVSTPSYAARLDLRWHAYLADRLGQCKPDHHGHHVDVRAAVRAAGAGNAEPGQL